MQISTLDVDISRQLGDLESQMEMLVLKIPKVATFDP